MASDAIFRSRFFMTQKEKRRITDVFLFVNICIMYDRLDGKIN